MTDGKKDYARINVNILFGVMLLIAFSFLLQFVIMKADVYINDSISLIVLYAVFVYLYILLSLKRRVKGITFFAFFLLISFFFYFGQHILSFFNSSYLRTSSYYTILNSNVSKEYVIKGSFLIIRTLLLLFFGYMVGRSYEKRIEFFKNKQPSSDYFFSLVFTIIFFSSLIPAFVIAVYRMGIANAVGYSELREMDDTIYLSGGQIIYVFSYLRHWFLPSCYALIMVKKGFLRNGIFAVLILYSLIYILSGSRYEILKIIGSIFLIIYVWDKRSIRKDSLKIVIIGFFAVVVLSTISKIRDSGYGINKLLESLSEGFLDSSIAPVLWESGITFHSVSNLLMHCPSDVPFANGSSLIGSILVCLPNALRFGFFDTHVLHTSAIFSPFFYGNTWVGYGSSFIAEAYYNFGFLYPAVILVYGVLLGKLEQRLFYAADNQLSTTGLLVIYIFGELTYGIRSDLYGIPRQVLLYVLLPILLVRLLSKIRLNK